jgi:small subunit ribosomal protein S20
MANHASAEKRNRQRINRTRRNRSVKSAVRSAIKLARTAVAGQKQDAQSLVVAASSALDRAASKGVVHRKAAARSKARLARALFKASKPAAALGPAASRPRRRPAPRAGGVSGLGRPVAVAYNRAGRAPPRALAVSRERSRAERPPAPRRAARDDRAR